MTLAMLNYQALAFIFGVYLFVAWLVWYLLHKGYQRNQKRKEEQARRDKLANLTGSSGTIRRVK